VQIRFLKILLSQKSGVTKRLQTQMLQCKKITEAPGRASFIVRFVALLGPATG
jgi:hypothetical protein